MTADDWAARFASGERIAERVAVVVAHPDDETLWAGPLLGRLDDGVLILVTDGAPADMEDAHRLGFATREDYAGARAAELDRALEALGYRGERRAYGVRDKEAVEQLAAVEERLREDLAGAAVVLTHPYEGGHPDHDACALTVARAAAAPVVEFAAYHLRGGERRFGEFWPNPDHPEHGRPLDPAAAARVDAALRAHPSQVSVFGDWRPTREHFRPAPAYDFTAPPPPGEALYDGFGWAMTAQRWRAIAAAHLRAR